MASPTPGPSSPLSSSIPSDPFTIVTTPPTTATTLMPSATASSSIVGNNGGGGGGGQGGGGQDGGNIASSASLYLYTFLATLVLLLSVSGAIILRSFILRRRHRLLVEEAIRNGTWIPPSPGEGRGTGSGSGRNRVDISKKPVMWDAYVLEKHHEDDAAELGLGSSLSSSSRAEQEHWEWDSIRPFSAAYLPPPPGPPKPLRLASSDSTSPSTSTGTDETPYHPPRLSYARRFIRFIRPDDPESQPYPLNQRRLSQVNLDASQGVDWSGHPKKLRVAVLIAMPRERPSTPSIHEGEEEREKEVPLVEFGVAEMDVKGLGHELEDHHHPPRKSESGSAATAEA